MRRLESEVPKALVIKPNWNLRRLGLAAAALMIFVAGLVIWQATRGDAPEDQIEAIMENAASTKLEIQGREGYEELAGAFVIAPDQRMAVLQLENLDVLPPDQTYQLWMARGENDRISSLLFRPEVSDATMLVDLPTDFETFIVIGVTIEPAGGSEAPTGDAVFSVRLPE